MRPRTDLIADMNYEHVKFCFVLVLLRRKSYLGAKSKKQDLGTC